MTEREISELKQYAELAQGKFYQQFFKPYLLEILAKLTDAYDFEVTSEFASLKRDLTIAAKMELITAVTDKIETAGEKLGRLAAKDFNKPELITNYS